MIVTPRFVFLHLHKSGGTFVNEALLRHEPGAYLAGYHWPHTRLPAARVPLPVFGLVRNPFDYYLSWDAFQRARPTPNALHGVLSEGGTLGFAATLRRMLSLGCDDALLEHVCASLPRDYANHGLNLPGPVLRAIRGTGLGFYSFLFRHLYGDRRDVHIARMERMRVELPAHMTAAGVPAGGALLAFLGSAPPRNASAHPPAAGAYDATLRALVADRDRVLRERFGYAAASEASRSQVGVMRGSTDSTSCSRRRHLSGAGAECV